MKQWIVFEGGEGSGKTTLMAVLKRELEERGFDVLCTREPGGVPIAEDIRAIILDPKNTELDPIAEALLFAAARRQHLVEKVLPALKKGQMVLMDRFVDSSLAYQGYARGIGVEDVRQINEFAIQGHRPDMVFLLDLDPQSGLERINANRNRLNRLDLEKVKFHEKVREGYLSLAKHHASMKVLDAKKSVEELVKEVLEELLP
ncbi:MAG: dTMP kinase [Tissierellia bacterium]|nr:dTMP kinase [Bacillota bacterium]NLL22907.1 dTMP kinase [Tissierellia bacterium]